MYNICITGKSGSGKSNLVNLILSLQENEVYGFKSIRKFENGKIAGFSLVPFLNSKINLDLDFRIADFGKNIQVHSETFEDFAILHFPIPDSGLVVMDEIGRFESNSPIFLSKIKKCFDSPDIDVLAVLKKEDIEFINNIKKREDVILLDLDMVSFDFAFQAICTCLGLKVDFLSYFILSDSFFNGFTKDKDSFVPEYSSSLELVDKASSYLDFKYMPIVITDSNECFYHCQSRGYLCFINDKTSISENISFALNKLAILDLNSINFAIFMNFYNFYINPEDFAKFLSSGAKEEVAFYSLDSSCLFTASKRYFNTLSNFKSDEELAFFIDDFI